MIAYPIVVDGLGYDAGRIVRVASVHRAALGVIDLATGQGTMIDRRGFRPMTAEEHARWVCVDLDGTLLEEPQKGIDPLPLGAVRPGAADFCAALQAMGCRVSIYTARFSFITDPEAQEEEIRRIASHLDAEGVPFDDVYVGLKPAAHAFVDDRAISALDLGFPEILAKVEALAKPMQRDARLGVDQAVEKAKKLVDGTVLSQESYHDITSRMDSNDQLPFALALANLGIAVKTGSLPPGRVTYPVASNPEFHSYAMVQEPVDPACILGRTVYSYEDGQPMGQTVHMHMVTDGWGGLDVVPARTADVNLVDPPETTERVHDVGWETDYPASEPLEGLDLADPGAADRQIEGGVLDEVQADLAEQFRRQRDAAIEAGFGQEVTDLAEESFDEAPVGTPNRMEQDAVSIEDMSKDDRHRVPGEGKISRHAQNVLSDEEAEALLAQDDQTHADPADAEIVRTAAGQTTWMKLKDGSWGLRVSGSAYEGQSVTVTKRSGESTVETVGRVMWTGQGVSICTVGTRAGAGRSTLTEPCAECGERPGVVERPDSSGIVMPICRSCDRNTSRYERSYM